MSSKLEVSFNSPQCGWMSIGFEDGVGEFHTTTAHAPHERALPELLKILTDLASSDGTNAVHVLKWNRDPEEFDFEFQRNSDELRIKIYQFPTEDRDNAERELVFEHTGKTADVIRSFEETFVQLYEDRDTDEFEFNWRQPFPYAEFEEFKSKIGVGRI